ncbi:MAG: hypothetical protein LQ337_006275 [Flavoplaca oasis]|nr:MAG: hypothetical protein LQ337_006275 [Flavoplaca oasis]
MGRELQKKKNKSSLNKVKHKPKSKKLNLQANPIIAKNWNKKQTLTQNYHRLGLVSKLNPRTGGIEPSISTIPAPGSRKEERRDSLAITNVSSTTLVPGTARIIRDESGNVVKVVHEGGESGWKRKVERVWAGRRLVDELGGDDDEEEEGQEDGGGGRGRNTQHDLTVDNGGVTSSANDGGRVVSQLARMASMEGEKKRPRKQSRREEEWVERLVEKYGDDVGKMVRDRKLNPMQQSHGDIAKRVRIWRETRKKKEGNPGDGDESIETA